MKDRLLRRGVVFFALWTLAAHLTVFTAGNLYDLIAVFALLGLLWLVLRRYLRSSRGDPFASGVAGKLPSLETRAEKRLFAALAFVVLSLTLLAHRPDADDALYLHLAVLASEDPRAPILEYDQQHDLPRLIVTRRSSRLSALIPLGAAAALVSGVPPIYFFHLLLPPVAALFFLLVYRELFRVLTPRIWVYGVLAVTVFLIADGAVHRSYGNFSLVRLHQGKGVLLTVFVPLLIAWGLRFARLPSSHGFLLLGAAQVAAVGCSSTGLVLAPLVTNLAVLAGALDRRSWRRRLRILSAGALSSVYLVAAGAWARRPLYAHVLMHGGDSVPGLPVSLGEHLSFVFGDGRFAVLHTVVAGTAFLFCKSRLARRLCLLYPLVVGLFFLNPLTADIFAKYLIPAPVYWRSFWLLPMPLLAALVLLSPLRARRLERRWCLGAFFCLLALVLAVSERSIFARENQVRMALPGLKVPAEYALARSIADRLVGRPTVLLDEPISTWIPTFKHHPYPLVSRILYSNRSRFLQERDQRTALKLYIMGRLEMSPDYFGRQLARYSVACVALSRANPWHDDIRQTIVAADFDKVDEKLGYEVWVRIQSSSGVSRRGSLRGAPRPPRPSPAPRLDPPPPAAPPPAAPPPAAPPPAAPPPALL